MGKMRRLSTEGIAKLHPEPNLRFFRWIRFFAKRLWPIRYVTLQKIEPTKKSLNFARKASFAIPSLFCIGALLASNDAFTAEHIEEKHSLKTNEDTSQKTHSQQTSKETENPAPPPK